jgi:hypothetical protein
VDSHRRNAGITPGWLGVRDVAIPAFARLSRRRIGFVTIREGVIDVAVAIIIGGGLALAVDWCWDRRSKASVQARSGSR